MSSQTSEDTVKKTRIQELEQALALKDDELKAKEKSFEDALVREQQKSRDREQKEATKRQELSNKILQLTDEKALLKSELDSIRDQADEWRRMEDDYSKLRRENVNLRATHTEELSNVKDELSEKRRLMERQQQDISDLRCQVSIHEHKLLHHTSKQLQLESLVEESNRNAAATEQLKEKVLQLEKCNESDAMRHTKDRKGLEEKLDKATSELKREKEGPSRVDIVSNYESKLEVLTTQLSRGIKILAHVELFAPLTVPHDVSDTSGIDAFFTAAEQKQRASRRRVSAEDIVESLDAGLDDQVDKLHAALQRLGGGRRDTQWSLCKRFHDCVEANVAASRSFGATSGFTTDEPVVLLNQVAGVTAERDALALRCKELSELVAESEQREKLQISGLGKGANSNNHSPESGSRHGNVMHRSKTPTGGVRSPRVGAALVSGPRGGWR